MWIHNAFISQVSPEPAAAATPKLVIKNLVKEEPKVDLQNLSVYCIQGFIKFNLVISPTMVGDWRIRLGLVQAYMH